MSNSSFHGSGFEETICVSARKGYYLFFSFEHFSIFDDMKTSGQINDRMQRYNQRYNSRSRWSILLFYPVRPIQN